MDLEKLNDIDSIVNFILNKDYGSKITFNDLQKFTSYRLNDEFERYKFKGNTMAKVKNVLINHGYILKSIQNVGYYILMPKHIQSYTFRNYIKKPMRQFLKAEIILSNTEIKKLNSDELLKHNTTLELSKEIIRQNEKSIYNRKSILERNS